MHLPATTPSLNSTWPMFVYKHENFGHIDDWRVGYDRNPIGPVNSRRTRNGGEDRRFLPGQFINHGNTSDRSFFENTLIPDEGNMVEYEDFAINLVDV